MLNPKKYQTLIPDVAKEAGVTDQCARDAVDFFWAAVRKSLSNLEAPRIQVEELGYFEVQRKKLSNKIKEYERFATLPPPEVMTFQKHLIADDILKNLEKSRRLQRMVDEEVEKRKEISKRKNEQRNKKNMGEQETDS